MPPRRSSASAILYARCWTAATSHDLDALLELAADPSLTVDMVATIAPSAFEHEADATLVRLVLAHASASAGVVGRYATHSDPSIRLLVAQHPLTLPTALDLMGYDADQRVREAARARMNAL